MKRTKKTPLGKGKMPPPALLVEELSSHRGEEGSEGQKNNKKRKKNAKKETGKKLSCLKGSLSLDLLLNAEKENQRRKRLKRTRGGEEAGAFLTPGEEKRRESEGRREPRESRRGRW